MSNLASRLAASESASSTILAKDRTLSCDTRQTGLNNNALVIGPSGAGKTRNVPEGCELLTVARRMGVSLG